MYPSPLRRSLVLTASSLALALGPLCLPAAAEAPQLPQLTADFSRNEELPAGEVGGRFAGRGLILDTEGREIGKMFYDCATESVHAHTVGAFCTGAIVIPGRGDIALQGYDPGLPRDADTQGDSFSVAVTGGTGEFKGAEGQANLTHDSRPATYTITFE